MAFKVLNDTELAALSPAKKAKYEKDLAAYNTNGIVELVKPKILVKSGTIVGISERPESDKFKHATKIVTVEDLLTGEIFDVFITLNQWREYNCKSVVYMGNVVTFNLEDCIKGVTGYLEFPDSVELTAHENSFKSFNRSVETSVPAMLRELSKSGSDSSTNKMIIEEVNKVRAMANRQQAL